jgi:hypothetical protein
LILGPHPSVTPARVFERGAFDLAFVPHSTDDGARMETHAEPDEERDQRTITTPAGP